ncbi:hypothetical protein GcM1_162003 [Golovinomyces cichoracearum]|uniref:CCHC-type domain-containing protein n=1 Tax=Golovinomyces cichoracearum TaxID=62708 RepID=A0A420J8P8_9PEZI|nr:hypothetical protein GcM1_162003 [Golovinomyces cichoracearum]
MPVEQAIYSKTGIKITLQGQSAPYYQYEISPTTSGAPGKAQIIKPNAISTNTGLPILDPRKDDQKADEAEEGTESAMQAGDRKCYECGKIGHLTKDCTLKKKIGYNSRTGGISGGYNRARSSGEKLEQITIKVTLFHENKPHAFSQRIRTQFRKMVSRKSIPNKRNKDRAYTSGAPEDDDEDLAPSKDWRDEDVETFIDQIFMSIEQDQEEENDS